MALSKLEIEKQDNPVATARGTDLVGDTTLTTPV
jgi:hypothetical protein